MFLRQASSGEYYVCTNPSGASRSKEKKSRGKTIFLVKHSSTGSCGRICDGIYTPKDMVGKRIMLKVEVVE